MKTASKILSLIVIGGFLCSCLKPGPITLGSKPTPVTDKQGNVHIVNYKVDKKKHIQVPAGTTGADLTTAKIKAEFAQDPALNAYNIDVSTQRGVVTLAGIVPNDTTRSYAIKMARTNKGVLAVDAKNLVIK